MSKPKIGYTTRRFALDPLQWLIHLSIWIAGGVPVRLHPDAARYSQPLDGLIIGGGTDLYPALYELDPKPHYAYDHDRDEMEIKWLAQAQESDLPTLGICRGAQLLNVTRGGTLHVDVAKLHAQSKYPTHWLAQMFFRKEIEVEASSKLAAILSARTARVNSMHSQAIDKVGSDLIVTAREDNGVIQAIEDPDKSFCMGVQFHPEALLYRRKFRNIFKALVKAAG